MDAQEFLKGLPLTGALEPREYQIAAAAEVVEKGNSLVVMPTALGKTFVSILVMAKLLATNPDSKILFLAPTKPLAVQQAASIRELISIPAEKVLVITGETGKEGRKELYARAQIISATPQTIENDLDILGLNDFSLIVFDEAHRTIGEYAYATIAKRAQGAKALLLGLTASPSSEKGKIEEICGHLAIRHVVARNETDDDVAQYVNKITVERIPVELNPELLAISSSLQTLAQESYLKLSRLDFLSLTSSRPNKTQLLAARMRLLSWNSPAKYSLISVLARLMNVLHALDLLESEGVAALHSYIINLEKRKAESKAVRELAADYRIKAVERRCSELLAAGIEHPKIFKLVSIVSSYALEGKSVIVFAHFRDSVRTLVERLNAAGVSAKALVGKSGEGMNQKRQVATLEEFRNKGFSVLVGTSVIEEGIDVPAADAVVFYDAVPSEIRAIQRRGRTGRVREGKAIILYTKGTKDEAYHWSSRNKERKMRIRVEELKKGVPARQERLEG
ncbi:DEAD/DEAH box helicase family protein [Candidatus Micrarchaeota archaeon]|nr:DEAD/DEAH box helicase family protein [Candidatus Micrarchaeota archaeon]